VNLIRTTSSVDCGKYGPFTLAARNGPPYHRQLGVTNTKPKATLEGTAMSQKAVERFLKALDEDQSLKNEFAARMPAKSTDSARVVAFASSRGFDFTEDELQKEAERYGATPPAEIGENDLNAAVGGLAFTSLYGTQSTALLRSVYSSTFTYNKLV
jgi:predicted ribosomally synthesized peptide with nif11-like leader